MPDNGQVDFAEVARRTQRMQGELAQVKEDLRDIRATGHGRDGLVAATVSGEGLLVGLRIDPSVIDPGDPGTLGDLVVTAVNDAHRELAEQRAERMSRVAGGLDDILAGLRQGGGRADRRPA
jgi:nucleoid-associated protein EbfC